MVYIMCCWGLTFVIKVSQIGQSKRFRLLPVYVTGVLTSLDEAELIKFLHELIVNISVEENGWDNSYLQVLKDVIGQLW